ncbi:MAG: FadR family transcriptional regulator [Deltaproteobacteria bacterium]|nr:FadR family transcriptional regulator [Deltaproteobacteria bacterium]MBW2368435.1 FadR family transcriptional regulator [Deltaproteobacteria bacterium]
MMKFEAIQRKTASQSVVDQILQRLKAGEMKPGDRLPAERDLATMFGVGRSSVREAIRALDVLGYLESVQGKGTFVTRNMPQSDPTADQLMDTLDAVNIVSLQETRIVLESKAAELAALQVDEKKLEAFEAILAKMAAAGENDHDFLQADLEFHLALTEASDNMVIFELVKLLAEKIHAHDVKFLGIHFPMRDRSLDSLRNIVECLRRKDATGAAEGIREHLNLVRYQTEGIIAVGRNQ